MKKKNRFVSLLLALLVIGILQVPVKAVAQTADTATVNSLILSGKEKLTTAPDSTILLGKQAADIADKIDFQKGKALALKNIGLGYFYQTNLVEALNYWTESLKIFENINDQAGIANLLNNIASVYSSNDDNEKALEYSLRSLQIAEKLGDKLRILSALSTVAGVYYANPATIDTALNYFLRALPISEEIGNTESYGVIAENIGEIYYEKGKSAFGNKNFAKTKEYDAKALEYFNKAIKALGNTANSPFAYNGIGKVYLRKGNSDEALKYHSLALSIAEKTNGKTHIMQSYRGMANVYTEKNDFATALMYFKRSEELAKEIDSKSSLKDIYEYMSEAYYKAGDLKNAYTYHRKFADYKDSVLTESTEKKLGALRLEFDLEKKQSQINLLTKDNDLQTAKIKRQQFAKNAFLVGLCLVFVIALLIFRNYLVKVRTHKILDKQKNEIEGLLLNILPKEVARELQASGHATPRHYDSVSVMFTDFQAFTIIADNMSPNELVAELDACFIAFDNIIEKHNLEKIKTIGDSYMCAGGIPVPDENHVLNIVKAGLEIQEYISEHNIARIQRGLKPWVARIGLHAGPVVAGVVGKKKYAYDIWGSTVNIASRMEANGEPGKVNVSQAVYEIIKDHYTCIPRGKISAKNIGEIDMYFIEDKPNGKMNLSKEKRLEIA
jgi:class 3 adenylate cyclase/tetratricopeptide (TPR) repeat protein